MKPVLDELKAMLSKAAQNPIVRKRVGWGLAIFLVLQVYFVRELIAAELLFGMLFAFMLALAGVSYVIGTIGVNGLGWAEMGARVVADTARRSYSTLEEISKKPFRHLRSESAQ